MYSRILNASHISLSVQPSRKGAHFVEVALASRISNEALLLQPEHLIHALYDEKASSLFEHRTKMFRDENSLSSRMLLDL